MKINVALAGNPNSGKTTLFNALTGSSARVGNWPGVTVDKREGTYKKNGQVFNIVDLPGIYSLSPYTSEEVIAREFLLNDNPDVIVNVVDATNLERNLYLTTQFLETDIPLVIALNMSDLILKRGEAINVCALEEKLGVPVVLVSALKASNLDELMEEVKNAAKTRRIGRTVIENEEFLKLVNKLKEELITKNITHPLFRAIKLAENDEIEVRDHKEYVHIVKEFKKTFNDELFENDFEALIADARYRYISCNLQDVIVKKDEAELACIKSQRRRGSGDPNKTEKIDRVLTHRFFAFPIFFLIMFFIFHFTFSSDLFFMGKMGLKVTNKGLINFFTGIGYMEGFEGDVLKGVPTLGVFLQNWMNFLTGSIINLFESFMPFGTWYTSLLVDGILTGLAAVLSFIPQILLLFLFLAVLEDSGYMARIAFIFDRAFRKLGLSGRALIPMLTGFGCSVPAIMATRTLVEEKEKKRTIRLITCFSCGAKAPIWALLARIGSLSGFAGDFFVFSIYIGGILVAIIAALFMNVFSKNHSVSPFVLELPNYHLPKARNVMMLLWEKLKHYLIKAGTIILASTVVIWFLSNFGWDFYYNNAFNTALVGKSFKLGGNIYPYFIETVNESGATNYVYNHQWSILGTIGQGFRYLFYPLGALDGGWTNGVESWKYSVSIITGLVAKEDVVSTMAQLGLNEKTITLSVAGAYSFATFNLFTIPCIAAISAARAEQTRKDFYITLLWWFGFSYVTTLVVYYLFEAFMFTWWLRLIAILVLISLIIGSLIYVSKRQKKTEKRGKYA